MALVAGVLGLALASTAAAARPGFNSACDGTKIEPVVSGTYAIAYGSEAGSITITVRETPAGEVFDVETDASTHIVTTVVVKGGTGFETYTFSPGANSATDLHASTNPSSGTWYGLSHLCVSTDVVSEIEGGGE
jgi:hypothetical protein